jgi:hypothetical protein
MRDKPMLERKWNHYAERFKVLAACLVKWDQSMTFPCAVRQVLYAGKEMRLKRLWIKMVI